MEKITIPGPGEKKRLNQAGMSVVIILAEDFNDIEDVPKISFNQVSERYPITTGSKYPYDNCGFEKLVIEGTAAAEGSTAYIAVVDVCVEFQINWNESNIKSIAGNTFTVAMDGNPKTIPEMALLDDDGNLPKSVYLSAAGGDILYRYNDGDGQDPAPDGNESNTLGDGRDPIEFAGEDFFGQKLKFNSKVTGETPNVVVSPRY